MYRNCGHYDYNNMKKVTANKEKLWQERFDLLHIYHWLLGGACNLIFVMKGSTREKQKNS